MEIANPRNGLGRALPASILLHVLAAVLAVSATMPGPTVSPRVIDLTLLAPSGLEGAPVPARALTGRPATALRAGAPIPPTPPQSVPRADLPEPDPGPKRQAAAIPAPPEAGAATIGKPFAISVPEGSRDASAAASEPIAPVRSPVGDRSALPSLPPGAGSSSGGTRPTGPGRAIDLERGYGYLRDDIQRGIAYPPVARRMGWEGNVVVSFRIHPDGSASDIRVVRGSGFAVLDRNAVEAVRSASPFRTPPAAAEIVTPVVYRLTRENSPKR